MSPITEQIACPKYPDHGMVIKRWLHHDDRQMITKGEGEVFMIDCPFCGSYECQLPRYDDRPTRRE
jgi:hypothetical protein